MKQQCRLFIEAGIISGYTKDKLVKFGLEDGIFQQRKTYDEYYCIIPTSCVVTELSIEDLNELSKIGKLTFHEDYYIHLEVE